MPDAKVNDVLIAFGHLCLLLRRKRRKPFISWVCPEFPNVITVELVQVIDHLVAAFA